MAKKARPEGRRTHQRRESEQRSDDPPVNGSPASTDGPLSAVGPAHDDDVCLDVRTERASKSRIDDAEANGDKHVPSSKSVAVGSSGANYTVYNEPEDAITIDASQSFIQDIDNELQDGRGFVPFIGAGLSAPSGAPLIWELHHYLHSCVALALGIGEPGRRPWNPRTDQWPPFIFRSHHSQREWWTLIRDEFERRLQRDPWGTDVAIFQEAIGALAEWRAALIFLSRLVRETRGSGDAMQYRLALDAPNAEVIDSCLRRAMSGRQPTLGHRMLATLATLLRLDVILTTNFDDLLERAFEEARNPLSIFEVHISSSLPPSSALSEHRSLVKMHGNLYSLRVDYTLDALPVEADRWRFLEYLLSAQGRSEMAARLGRGDTPPKNLPFQKHLLVMGVAATERRTRAFIEHALRHLDEGFKVFWLCYSRRDVETVKSFAAEVKTQKGNWLKILRHPNLGLLFTELYQTIRHGIPTSGIIFPSAARLAIPPMSRRESPAVNSKPGEPDIDESVMASHAKRLRSDEVERARDQFTSKITAELERMQSEGYQGHKLIVATSKPSCSGVTSACIRVFEAVRDRGQIAVWLDMNDVSSVDDLFEQLLDAASNRIGAVNLLPAYVPKLPEVQAQEILSLIKATDSKWVFVLNARETPGTNLTDAKEIDDEENGEYQNNWLDYETAHPMWVGQPIKDDESNFCGQFLRFLSRLCGPQSPLVTVILMCRQRKDGKPSYLVESIVAKQALIDTALELDSDCSDFRERDAVVNAINWTRRGHDHRRFLQGLISLQRIRYLATVWTDAVSCTPPPQRASDPLEWVNELEDIGLVRRKPGGFIWIHSRTRTALRQTLREPATFRTQVSNAEEFRQLETYIKSWDPVGCAPTIHWDLAQWYRRILSASGSPGAVFEAIYHACRAAEEQLARARSIDDVRLATDRINWASALLHTHAFLVQTQGYSRGSCRRLGSIRANRCDKIDAVARIVRINGRTVGREVSEATRRLRIRCTEVMRAIAREVGEDRRAFDRQRELRLLLAGEGLNAEDRPAGQATAAMRKAMKDDKSRSEPDLVLEWVRSWRWMGMLGIATRSYSAARRSLLRSIRAVTDGGESDVPLVDGDLLGITLYKARQECATGVARVLGRRVADQQRLRIEVSRAFEQLITLEMQEGSLLYKVPGGEEIKGHYEQTLHRIEIAKSIVESVRSNDQSPDSHNIITALWCHSRLLMHQGMCAGRLNQPIEAMMLLADAEASLNYADSRRRGVDRAIIELHRAEVRLIQAGEVEVPRPWGGDTTLPFREFGTLFRREKYDSAIWRADGKALRESLADERSVERERQLRSAQSLVQDALSFLSRADRILLTRRRNVWWMTWYFQRTLTAIAASIWSSILEQRTPIPFLGPEAAPRGCETVADRLLEDARRMIRIDAYRLATVVEAYAECVRALYFRLFVEGAPDTLAERQSDMMRNLASARTRLVQVFEDRTKGDRRPAPPKSNKADFQRWEHQQTNNELAPKAAAYIQATLERSARILNDLRHPLR